jgi:molybdate transport system substrate-binding protein
MAFAETAAIDAALIVEERFCGKRHYRPRPAAGRRAARLARAPSLLSIVIYNGILRFRQLQQEAAVRRLYCPFCSIAIAACLSAASCTAAAVDVTVFAAASLKEAMDEQAKRFQAQTGNKVTVSYGASNALAKQIEAGAPADLFISADIDWMDYVDQRRLIAPGARFDLLRNTLVLIAPSTSVSTLKIGSHFDLAAALGTERLAMANPDSVPAGKYGKSALEKLGVWASVEKRLARTDTVRAALALVSRGETPLGIVYKTDAIADKGVRIVDSFPPNTHPPIVYPAAVVAHGQSTAARPLLDYLRSAPARSVWEKHGFGLAE